MKPFLKKHESPPCFVRRESDNHFWHDLNDEKDIEAWKRRGEPPGTNTREIQKFYYGCLNKDPRASENLSGRIRPETESHYETF